LQYHQLVSALSALEPIPVLPVPNIELLSVEIGAPEGPPSPEILCLLSPDDPALPGLLNQACSLLVCGPLSLPDPCRANLLCLPVPADPVSLFPRMRELFLTEQRLDSYARRLLSLLSGGGSLQRIVEEASRQLNAPLCVFDAGFKMIAAYQEFSSPDPRSQQLMSQGYMAPEDMKAINHAQIHQRVLKSSEPILIENPYYEGKRIISRLNLGSKNVGHVVMTDFARPFADSDYKAMAILRDIIVQRLQQDEFIRNSRGFHYEYLITDLLDGKVALGKQLEDRLAYVDLHFEDLIYITVAELARSTVVVNPTFLRDQLETLLPGSRTILYNGQVVTITTRRHTAPVSEAELEQVRTYCEKSGIYCGMSNPFRSVAELPQFYKQALRALELGLDLRQDDIPSLYVYRDHACEHLVNHFREMENPRIYCHPAIRELMLHDEEKGADLTATLYHYLRCERNVSLTADTMYLHRNTLMHRLKRIAEIVSLSLDDPEERQYLLLSLLVCQDWRH